MASLRAWWQQIRERRATRYLTQYQDLAANVLRLHPDLAVSTMQRVFEAQDTAPQRDTMAYPVLSSFGYGGSSVMLRTLPKTVPFAIRRFSEYPPARRAIQAIVQPIVDMPWHIVPRAAIGSDEHVKTAITSDQHARIVALTETLLNPNNEQSGREIFEMLLEDLVVFGGGCAEVQPNRSDDRPVFLFPVDAQSIRINMEWRPGNRTFRYSQGKGYVFGAMGVTDDVKLRDDELLYIKLNNRTHTPFGFGYLETAFDCYSADTEVLTKRGWIAWPEATSNDQFATRDPLTGMFAWQSPLKMHKVRRIGEMVHFQNAQTDMMVSPNHRMFGVYHTSQNEKSVSVEQCGFVRADVVEYVTSIPDAVVREFHVLIDDQTFVPLGQATRVPYDDYIYCATVPNETLYVRRNGKAMWCGNTVNAFVGAFQYAERRASNNTPNFGIFLGENVTVDQVRRWQHYWENEIEGYGKVPILGGGRQPSVFNMTGTGEDQLWLRWQEFLIRVIGMSFGLSPMKLGLMQDVNRSTAQESSANDWATMAPVANTLGNTLTHWLLWRRLGWKDLEFQWKVRTTDEMRQAEVLMEQYRMNGITVDEIRQFYGRPPLEDGLGDLTKTAYEMAVKAAAMGAVGVGGPENPMGHNNISGMAEVITPFDDDPDALQPEAKAWMRGLLLAEAEARRNS